MCAPTDVRQEGGSMRFTLHLPDGAPHAGDAGLAGPAQRAERAGRRRDRLAARRGRRKRSPRALEKFAGHRPSLQHHGRARTLGRGNVLLVDDYGHHPRELAAVFAAARGGWPERRLVVAFQPHRYSRTRDLFDEFAAVLSQRRCAGADRGLSRRRSADRRRRRQVAGARHPRARPHRSGRGQQRRATCRRCCRDVLHDGDLLLLMGAGDIGHVASDTRAAHGFAGAAQVHDTFPPLRITDPRAVRPRRRADGRHQFRARGVAELRRATCSRRCARAASTRTRSTASRR